MFSDGRELYWSNKNLTKFDDLTIQVGTNFLNRTVVW
jgi:hypothetical protein